MEMEIYNSKQEIGCRILLILVCTKKKMQAETISVYDYFSVHIDDIFSELDIDKRNKASVIKNRVWPSPLPGCDTSPFLQYILEWR